MPRKKNAANENPVPLAVEKPEVKPTRKRKETKVEAASVDSKTKTRTRKTAEPKVKEEIEAVKVYIHPLDKPVAYKPSFAHVKLRNGDKTIVAFRNDTIKEFAENTLDVCVKLTKREIDKLPDTVYFWEYGTHNLHDLHHNEVFDPTKPISIPD